MCESGVPDRQTIAVSSSKIGARNVAPASATHATTPSAVVSISSSTSSGDASLRHVPRTGAAANTGTPTASASTGSVTGRKDNQIAPWLRSLVVLSDDDYVLLHEVRIRGIVEIDEQSQHAVVVAHL